MTRITAQPLRSNETRSRNERREVNVRLARGLVRRPSPVARGRWRAGSRICRPRSTRRSPLVVSPGHELIRGHYCARVTSGAGPRTTVNLAGSKLCAGAPPLLRLAPRRPERWRRDHATPTRGATASTTAPITWCAASPRSTSKCPTDRRHALSHWSVHPR